MMMMN